MKRKALFILTYCLAFVSISIIYSLTIVNSKADWATGHIKTAIIWDSLIYTGIGFIILTICEAVLHDLNLKYASLITFILLLLYFDIMFSAALEYNPLAALFSIHSGRFKPALYTVGIHLASYLIAWLVFSKPVLRGRPGGLDLRSYLK